MINNLLYFVPETQIEYKTGERISAFGDEHKQTRNEEATKKNVE